MMKVPTVITVASLEVVVMPNGEVICGGRSLGWVSDLGKFLKPITPAVPPPSKRKRGAV